MVDLVAERRPTKQNHSNKSAVANATNDKPQLGATTKEAPVPQLSNDVAGTLVQSFKLLADETRLRILFFLMHRKEINVRSLCELLDQSQPAVSHHLALLRNAELIDSRRDGKHNFYRLMPAKFQQLIDTLAMVAPGEPSDVRFNDYVKLPPAAE